MSHENYLDRTRMSQYQGGNSYLPFQNFQEAQYIVGNSYEELERLETSLKGS